MLGRAAKKVNRKVNRNALASEAAIAASRTPPWQANLGSISMARLKKGMACASPFSCPVLTPMLKVFSASSDEVVASIGTLNFCTEASDSPSPGSHPWINEFCGHYVLETYATQRPSGKNWKSVKPRMTPQHESRAVCHQGSCQYIAAPSRIICNHVLRFQILASWYAAFLAALWTACVTSRRKLCIFPLSIITRSWD